MRDNNNSWENIPTLAKQKHFLWVFVSSWSCWCPFNSFSNTEERTHENNNTKKKKEATTEREFERENERTREWNANQKHLHKRTERKTQKRLISLSLIILIMASPEAAAILRELQGKNGNGVRLIVCCCCFLSFLSLLLSLWKKLDVQSPFLEILFPSIWRLIWGGCLWIQTETCYEARRIFLSLSLVLLYFPPREDDDDDSCFFCTAFFSRRLRNARRCSLPLVHVKVVFAIKRLSRFTTDWPFETFWHTLRT